MRDDTAQGDTAPDESVTVVPERRIPVPGSISAEAQAFLALAKPAVDAPEPPAIGDIAGWRAHAAEVNAGLTEMVRMRAEGHDAEVSEHTLAASTLYEIAPASAAGSETAILYVHGGGFFIGGGEAAYLVAVPFASRAGTTVFSIDYRMPPDHPYPAPLDDTVEAYGWLLERFPPDKIALYGASAGANLAPACILRARDAGQPLPAACALHSPAADLTHCGDSFATNQGLDIALNGLDDRLSQLYAGGHDLTDPLISPVFADFSAGFCPTVITTGTRDLLLSPSVMLHRALRRAGVTAELHVWDAMSHMGFLDAPEEQEVVGELIDFLNAHLEEDRR